MAEDGGGGETGDVGGAAFHVVGEHGNGDAIIDEDEVVGDKASDFAAVFDFAMAVEVDHFYAKAVVRVLAVFQLHLGEHLLVAFGLEDDLA